VKALAPAPAPVPKQSARPTEASAVRLAAPMEYEVVHSLVRVRASPAPTATELTMKRKGTVVSVVGVLGDWVQIELQPTSLATGQESDAASGSGWMLTNGRAMVPPLGMLLKPHVIPVANGAVWHVTRPGGCVGYPDPGGSALGQSGRALSRADEGCSVEPVAECGMWAQVRTEGGGEASWVELDAFLAG